MAGAETIRVEVAYARPDEQRIVEVDVATGTTALDAAKSSGIDRFFPEIDFGACDLGIFGKQTRPDQLVKAGDRVEIYRPLKADPREVRRQLAAQGKTMGGGKKRA